MGYDDLRLLWWEQGRLAVDVCSRTWCLFTVNTEIQYKYQVFSSVSVTIIVCPWSLSICNLQCAISSSARAYLLLIESRHRLSFQNRTEAIRYARCSAIPVPLLYLADDSPASRRLFGQLEKSRDFTDEITVIDRKSDTFIVKLLLPGTKYMWKGSPSTPSGPHSFILISTVAWLQWKDVTYYIEVFKRLSAKIIAPSTTIHALLVPMHSHVIHFFLLGSIWLAP